MTDLTDLATVVSVAPDLIQIEILSSEEYQQLGVQVEIGSYLKISDDNGLTVLAIVQSYRIKDRAGDPSGQAITAPTFIIAAQPVGRLQEGKFRRGGKQIAIPPSRVEIASKEVLEEIYGATEPERQLCLGRLAQNEDVRVMLDGDKFFGKHVGVVGSTGSGKSCTVAKILQEGIKASDDQQSRGVLNNSHIIIFDLHGEYPSAFEAANVINTGNLKLPYWLMNSEELEEMFVESRENNSHNQVSQFRQAVIANKGSHLTNLSAPASYDTPVYFSLQEVINYLANLNAEMISKSGGENSPKLSNGILVAERSDVYFTEAHTFVEASTSRENKAVNGPFHGEFNRFLMRLDARRNDRRLNFLLSPAKSDGSEYTTEDLPEILHQFTGYGDTTSNVTIIDLSDVPFEVLSVVVALISRIIFTLGFHFKRGRPYGDRDLPFLLVYEEAHTYIPQSDGSKYGAVKRAIERIAKEGRKYGISLMIVSQRPSEISETVFSQCNNFVVMRLTNPADQRYVKRLLPDTVNAITEALPSLERQEVIVIGDSVPVPSLVRIDDITARPDSHDINFHTEWQRDWLEVVMGDIAAKWQS